MLERDNLIIEFLEKFKVATTTQIKDLFFPSINTCRRRLKKLYDMKKIKRTRDNINKDYIYFLKEPKQLKHSLAIVNFYTNIYKKYKITNYRIEPNLGSIQPDMLFTFIDEYNKHHIAFLEVELSNKRSRY